MKEKNNAGEKKKKMHMSSYNTKLLEGMKKNIGSKTHICVIETLFQIFLPGLFGTPFLTQTLSCSGFLQLF